MSSPYNRVQTLFDTKLAELTDLPDVITENEIAFINKTSEDSPLTTKYMRTSLAPTTTRDLSIGIGGCDEFGGLFVVEIFTPVANGIKETNYWVDEIIDHFPKNVVLTDGTINVHIEQYTAAPGQPFANYHKGGVHIQWTCYVQR